MQIPQHLKPIEGKKFAKDGKTYRVEVGAAGMFLLINVNNSRDWLSLNCTTNAKKIEFILNKIKNANYQEVN